MSEAEKKIKTFQRTSRMQHVASKDGKILYQSNNYDEFMKMRAEYLDSLKVKNLFEDI